MTSQQVVFRKGGGGWRRVDSVGDDGVGVGEVRVGEGWGGGELKGKGHCLSVFEGFERNRRLFSPLCLHLNQSIGRLIFTATQRWHPEHRLWCQTGLAKDGQIPLPPPHFTITAGSLLLEVKVHLFYSVSDFCKDAAALALLAAD